jgi:hypothetical protein
MSLLGWLFTWCWQDAKLLWLIRQLVIDDITQCHPHCHAPATIYRRWTNLFLSLPTDALAVMDAEFVFE